MEAGWWIRRGENEGAKGEADSRPGVTTYNLPEQQHVLPPDEEYAAVDVGVQFSREDPLDGVLEHKVRCPQGEHCTIQRSRRFKQPGRVLRQGS